MRIVAQWALVALTFFSLALTHDASAQVPSGWTQYTHTNTSSRRNTFSRETRRIDGKSEAQCSLA
jgi:hypothetical protein